MKHVKVLGPGCARCQATAKLMQDAADQAGIEILLEKITDYATIAAYGVVSTPGIVIDGKLVHAGGLPKAETIPDWLKAD